MDHTLDPFEYDDLDKLTASKSPGSVNKTISECTSAWLFGDEGLMDLPNQHGLATGPAGPSYWNDPGYEFGPTGLQMLSGLPNPTEPIGFVPGTNTGWRSDQWNDLLIDSSKDSVKLHDSNAFIETLKNSALLMIR